MTNGRHRIGLLGPFAELPGEYVDVVSGAPEPAVTWQVVTEAVDSHQPSDLRALAHIEVLREGALRLRRWRPEAIMWACTSGSFILGKEYAIKQRIALEEAAGVPASSTSLSFVKALEALNVDQVHVLAPYPRLASEAFRAYLDEWHIRVVSFAHLDSPRGRTSELLDAESVRPALESLPTEGVVLIPDTAVWGFSLLEELGHASGRILVANQVTLWDAFRLVGMSTDHPRLGLLKDVP